MMLVRRFVANSLPSAEARRSIRCLLSTLSPSSSNQTSQLKTINQRKLKPNEVLNYLNLNFLINRRLLAVNNNAKPTASAPIVWDYDEHGPSSWIKAFPEGCGSHQSPINIDTTAPYVRYDVELGPLQVDYAHCKASTIWNSGHSFQVNFSLDAPGTLTGGPLKGKYQLVQFHGHWGPSHNVHGSEHLINSKSFPAELHFVHFNKQKYETIKEAIHHEDGLAVIGVFLKIHHAGKPHGEVQRLIEDIKDVDYNDHEMPLHFSIHPRNLMPANLEHYFTYPGSLTTPPLTECITWLVLSEPLEVSADQLAHFHELHRPRDKRPIDHNYRPVMPVNDRVVRASFPNYNDHTIDGPIDG